MKFRNIRVFVPREGGAWLQHFNFKDQVWVRTLMEVSYLGSSCPISFSVLFLSISSSSVRSLIRSSRFALYCSNIRSMESMMFAFFPLFMIRNWQTHNHSLLKIQEKTLQFLSWPSRWRSHLFEDVVEIGPLTRVLMPTFYHQIETLSRRLIDGHDGSEERKRFLQTINNLWETETSTGTDRWDGTARKTNKLLKIKTLSQQRDGHVVRQTGKETQKQIPQHHKTDGHPYVLSHHVQACQSWHREGFVRSLPVQWWQN